ncbi:carboxypeptidase D-like [Porites lutea]|uniref:carboxypeptidase D-like n=1 Tax=Porites lutea TaxID=51062 RepID=UPI003CC5F7B2
MATTWLIFCLGIVYSVQRAQSSGILPVKATHHNNSALHQVLEALAATYPNITRLYSIGKSYQGKELWVLEITKNPGRHIPGKPEFKYVANMHGNEVVGRELLLLFADYLCSNYGSNDRVTRLVDTTRIHLLPSMNPDGWESSNEGDCSSVRGRFNANGVDLNRNFPDPYDGQRNELQPETQAVMNWIHQEPFVLSANLHGGTLVVNYPFDNLPKELKRSGSRVYYSSPDDDIFVSIAKVYSKTHPTMHIGHPKCPIQRNERFADGITNGAAWYPISGGMQDYNYYKTNCFEITLELGCCKYPPALYIKPYWYANREPLLKYVELVHTTGMKGFVMDERGRPLEGARIIIENRAKKIKTSKDGDFWRLLVPGNYTVRVAKRKYKNTKLRVTVNPDQAAVVNITLVSKSSRNLNRRRPVKTVSPVQVFIDKDERNVSFHSALAHRDRLRLSAKAPKKSASLKITPVVHTFLISLLVLFFQMMSIDN